MSSSPYVREREIGRGGQGVVYQALQISLSRRVAMKLIQSDLQDRPEVTERFMREIQLLSKLRHPNIVQFFDSGWEDGQLFFTMELLEGRPLVEHLRDHHPLRFEDVRSITQGVAGALVELHRNGLVHRDVKLSNVFLEKGMVPKLIDFGLARSPSAADVTAPGTLMGTMRYMAPEVLEGAQAGPAQDVYALGAMMWELVCGSTFLGNASEATVLWLIRQGEIPSVREKRHDVPESLRRLIHQCLSRDPGRRPTADQLLERLERGGLAGRPPGRFQRVASSIREILTNNSFPIPFVPYRRGAKALLVLLAAGATTYVWRSPGDRPRPAPPAAAAAASSPGEAVRESTIGEVLQQIESAVTSTSRTSSEIGTWTRQDRSRAHTGLISLAEALHRLPGAIRRHGTTLDEGGTLFLFQVLVQVPDGLRPRIPLDLGTVPPYPEIDQARDRVLEGWEGTLRLLDLGTFVPEGKILATVCRAHVAPEGAKRRADAEHHRGVAHSLEEMAAAPVGRRPLDDCWEPASRILLLGHARVHLQQLRKGFNLVLASGVDEDLARLEEGAYRHHEVLVHRARKRRRTAWMTLATVEVWQHVLDRLTGEPPAAAVPGLLERLEVILEELESHSLNSDGKERLQKSRSLLARGSGPK